MTLEEYMSHTSIHSVDEAQQLLSNTKIFFWAMFIAFLIVKGAGSSIDSEIFALLWLGDIVLIFFFVLHCMKIIRLTKKVNKTSAVWAIFFAPISWIWFYPDLVKPLKIIVGEIPIPEKIELTHYSPAQKERNAEHLRKLKILGLGVLAFAFVIITANYLFGKGGDSISSSPANYNADYSFSSSDYNFRVIFPKQPVRSEENENDNELGNIKTITYESRLADSVYYIYIFEYANPNIDENSPNFNVDAALEGALNGMVNTDSSGYILSQNKTVIGYNKGLRYKVKISDEILDGILVYKGKRLYNIVVDYRPDKPPTNIQNYLGSFTFINPL